MTWLEAVFIGDCNKRTPCCLFLLDLKELHGLSIGAEVTLREEDRVGETSTGSCMGLNGTLITLQVALGKGCKGHFTQRPRHWLPPPAASTSSTPKSP